MLNDPNALKGATVVAMVVHGLMLVGVLLAPWIPNPFAGGLQSAPPGVFDGGTLWASPVLLIAALVWLTSFIPVKPVWWAVRGVALLSTLAMVVLSVLLLARLASDPNQIAGLYPYVFAAVSASLSLNLLTIAGPLLVTVRKWWVVTAALIAWFVAFVVNWGARLLYTSAAFGGWFRSVDLETLAWLCSQLVLGLVFLLATLWLLAVRRQTLTPPELR